MTHLHVAPDPTCRLEIPGIGTTFLRLEIDSCMARSAATQRPLPEGREQHYWGVANEIAQACRTYCATCVTCRAPDTPCYRILRDVYAASRESDPNALPEIVGMVSTKLWPDPDPDVLRQH